MASKFKPGIRVRGIKGTKSEGKEGTIFDEILYIDRASKPTKPTKGSPKWRVIWDGEKEAALVAEEELEIV